MAFTNKLSATVTTGPRSVILISWRLKRQNGRIATSLLHPDSHHLLHDYIQVAQAGGTFAATAVHQRRDGSLFHAELRGAAFMYEKRPCLLSVIRDVSQRAQDEQYGSVAAVIAFLTWAYLSGLIFLFGAYLNVAYYRLKS
jgi:hypothetical protein